MDNSLGEPGINCLIQDKVLNHKDSTVGGKKALQAYLEDLEGIEGQCLLQRIDKEGTECAVSLDEIS